MASFDVEKIKEQLEALKSLPRVKEVIALRQRLLKELQKLSQSTIAPVEVEVKTFANKKRSSKLRKYHRYIRLIRNNFPNLSVSEIRRQFKERRQGNEADIPDVIWQNPSP